MSESTPKQTRRGILAGISASVAAPAVASDGTATTSELASILPEGPPRTRFFVEANPVLNVITLYCSAGPRGGDGSNIMAQIVFSPDQAERIARTILADLDGFAERVAEIEAKGYGEVRR